MSRYLLKKGLQGGLTRVLGRNILYSIMPGISIKDLKVGDLSGSINSEWNDRAIVRLIANIREQVFSDEAEVLSDGRNRVVSIEAGRRDGSARLAVKAFGRRSLWKDRVDSAKGSRAKRTFDVACEMISRGVATPEPVCYVERWLGKRLKESYYFSVFEHEHVSFKDELIRLFKEDPECRLFMSLLETAASGVARMHNSGVMHCDLGNQNILLRRKGDNWTDVSFMDLNRCRIHDELSMLQRARDLSRIYLPSDLLRIFIEMYFQGEVPPAEFLRAERFYRACFRWHTKTRPLRHPLRRLKKFLSGQPDEPGYPIEKDMWIWDSRSAQPISVMRPRDRRRWYSGTRHLMVAKSTFRVYRDVMSAYSTILPEAYNSRVSMDGRFGMSLGLDSGNDSRELELLDEIGDIPVLLRLQPHKRHDIGRIAAAARKLKTDGRDVTLSLLQDRHSVLKPAEWDSFVKEAADAFKGCVDSVEAGHAVNRVKWGVWDLKDYAAIACPVKDHFGSAKIRVMGPGVIDFEYPYIAAALDALPEDFEFDCLSHHLYVDRRGAPENTQSGYSTLEKAALLKAMARVMKQTRERVVISEVNWPILGTGVWSPVNSPYESPGLRFNDPSVSEDDYAAYMIRYLLICICSGMVERVFWWRLVARGFGLVDDSDSSAWRKRPAFMMYKQLIKMMDGAEFVELRKSDEGAQILLFERYGGSMFAVGVTDGRSMMIDPPFECSRVFDAFGRDIESQGQIELGGTPVYFRAAVS